MTTPDPPNVIRVRPPLRLSRCCVAIGVIFVLVGVGVRLSLGAPMKELHSPQADYISVFMIPVCAAALVIALFFSWRRVRRQLAEAIRDSTTRCFIAHPHKKLDPLWLLRWCVGSLSQETEPFFEHGELRLSMREGVISGLALVFSYQTYYFITQVGDPGDLYIALGIALFSAVVAFLSIRLLVAMNRKEKTTSCGITDAMNVDLAPRFGIGRRRHFTWDRTSIVILGTGQSAVLCTIHDRGTGRLAALALDDRSFASLLGSLLAHQGVRPSPAQHGRDNDA